LGVDARFCGHCGKTVRREAAQPRRSEPVPPPPMPAPPSAVQAPPPVVQAPPYAQPVAVQPVELVYGVIPGATQSKGVLGLSKSFYTVVVTSHRLLFAKQTNEMMKQKVTQARAEAKQQGKGFFGQWAAQMGANYDRHYLQKQPQAILAEHSENFFLANNQVRSVRIRSNRDDDNSQTTYRLELEATTGKMRFDFQFMNVKEVKQLLGQALGSGVKIR